MGEYGLNVREFAIKIIDLESEQEKILVPVVKYDYISDEEYIHFVDYFPEIQRILDKSKYRNVSKDLSIDLHRNIYNYLFGTKKQSRKRSRRSKKFSKKNKIHKTIKN